MSLWKKTDEVSSRPTWIDLATYPAGTELVFVDVTEAQNPTNLSKGLCGPGWWLYREALNSNGEMRYYTEMLVGIAETAANAGDDTDDLFVPDVTTTITISVQPQDQSTVAGSATFGVTASFTAGTGTLVYQWQTKVAGSTRWVLVGGETTASLALTAQDIDNDGDQYRVLVSGGGAKTVTSGIATLTFDT